jgi:redox-sensitive bicupin YhaK (pirin superfamily)
MDTQYYRAKDRGHLEAGWLSSYYSFNFETMDEFEKIRFGQLRMLNNDTIQGGAGFQSHAHKNMEIVTIPLSGGLEHRDSLGNTHKIFPGDVQVMTAGTGVIHSEWNLYEDQETNFLQIWIFPRKNGLFPGYQQRSFKGESRINTWDLQIAPGGRAPLSLQQDAWFSRIVLEPRCQIQYQEHQKGTGVLFYVIHGLAQINEECFSTADAVGFRNRPESSLTAIIATDIIAIEVPLKKNNTI